MMLPWFNREFHGKVVTIVSIALNTTGGHYSNTLTIVVPRLGPSNYDMIPILAGTIAILLLTAIVFVHRKMI